MARCSDKRRYSSEAAAEKALARVRQLRSRGAKRESRVYRCNICGPNVWHLTSQPYRQRGEPGR